MALATCHQRDSECSTEYRFNQGRSLMNELRRGICLLVRSAIEN